MIAEIAGGPGARPKRQLQCTDSLWAAVQRDCSKYLLMLRTIKRFTPCANSSANRDSAIWSWLSNRLLWAVLLDPAVLLRRPIRCSNRGAVDASKRSPLADHPQSNLTSRFVNCRYVLRITAIRRPRR